MTDIRVIRTNDDYEAMRSEMHRLLDLDPAKGSTDRDRLDVLLVLLADYEAREVAPPQSDPVDAVLFRMDQLDLKPRDLEPYLGGRSRVSEVLSRKRPLSITMIRALHEGLGIPAEALINTAAPPQVEADDQVVPWERFPIREMVKRGWIAATKSASWTRKSAHELLAPLFIEAGVPELASAALFRRARHIRAARDMDEFALVAWTARALSVANSQSTKRAYDPSFFDLDHLRGLLQLSRLREGPRLAKEWLSDRGVVLVIVPHMSRTRLDGAAILGRGGRPVIALTLRYDRLDNFWFTLLHEIGHVKQHLMTNVLEGVTEYYDDLDVDDATDKHEEEADRFARECLVPTARWQSSAVAFAPSVDAAVALADELEVNPAVVAGRVRHEKRNFRLLGSLVGAGQVRKQFSEVAFD